jgi:hypothetical protein
VQPTNARFRSDSLHYRCDQIAHSQIDLLEPRQHLKLLRAGQFAYLRDQIIKLPPWQIGLVPADKAGKQIDL